MCSVAHLKSVGSGIGSGGRSGGRRGFDAGGGLATAAGSSACGGIVSVGPDPLKSRIREAAKACRAPEKSSLRDHCEVLPKSNRLVYQ